MRCHSQALTIKLTRDVPLDEIADVLGRANEVPSSRTTRRRRSPVCRPPRCPARSTCRSGGCARCSSARPTCRPSRSAISRCGARPSRAACCGFWRSSQEPLADRFNILLVGRGRLGQLIEAARRRPGPPSPAPSTTPTGDLADRARWRDIDVAIDASPGRLRRQPAGAVRPRLQPVVGTTGWQAHAADVRGSTPPASAPWSAPTSRSAPR